MTEAILSKIGIQQRVLPAYRAPFFDLLAAACNSGLSVFAGSPAPAEALGATGELQEAHQVLAENLHLGHGRYYACVQKNILAWLEDWQPEVLIAEANPRYLNTPKAVRWMKSRGRPVIGWGLGAPPVRGFWRKLLRERFLGGFDALLTYSQLGADQYRTMGFPPERIFVAPNAVSKRPVQEIPSRPAEYADGCASVLFVGRLQARKRVDLLLRACADLPERQRPRLTIVGDGPASGDLRALAAEIYPQAVFTGELRGEALAQYFRAADVFVLPGTGGLAVQEAMGWGLPVIVAEADGTQVDLVRPENGWQVPAGNGSMLAACLADALADPARLRRMGRVSYRIVSEEINLEAMVSAFERAISAVIQLGPRQDTHPL